MASVQNVLFHIAERDGNAFVEVSYKVVGDAHDMASRQSYRELVDLIGDDVGPGEDGRSEVIPNSQLSDEVVTFTPSQQEFVRTRARNLSSAVLDEDPGIFIQEDEIRARITLTPLPPQTTTVLSRIVRRGGILPPIRIP